MDELVTVRCRTQTAYAARDSHSTQQTVEFERLTHGSRRTEASATVACRPKQAAGRYDVEGAGSVV